MRTADEPIEVKQLTRLNEYGPDDLFICCASFEDRCLSSVSKMGIDYRTRFAIIFVIEEPLYKKQVDNNLYRLQSELGKRTSKGTFVISCQRDNPVEGVSQLKNIWKQCGPRNPEEPFITIDIISFNKVYLFELLDYFLVK